MNNNKFNQGENMREYLFRGFCKKENRWEYGFLEWERESDEKPDNLIQYIHTGFNNEGYEEFFKVIPETVGQYTGLKDSTKWEDLTEDEQKEWLSSKHEIEDRNNQKEDWNGKKVFEGDILKYTHSNGSSIGFICFMDGAYILYKNEDSYDYMCIFEELDEKDKPEIIGNIHDNPELLDDPPSAKI